MRTLLTYGVIKSGKLVDSVVVTGGKAVVTHSPRSLSQPSPWMIPVIRDGLVIGYQNLFGSDTTIYTLEKEEI